MSTYYEDSPSAVEVIDISSLPPARPLPQDAARVSASPAPSTDLNAVRDRLVAEQQTNQEVPNEARLSSLYVDPQGHILLREETGNLPARRLSPVTTEVFYSPDLNKIAATIRENQERDSKDPSARDRQLFVDDEGNILFGDQVDPGSAERFSRVTQETFYGTGRREEERAIVHAKLPANAYEASDGEVRGWVYNITNEFGDRYDLFLWRDKSDNTYKVSLLEPRLGGTVGVEDCHLYEDSTICLKEQGGPGYRKLEDAYARSVIWTRGASCYLRGYGFQFNVGQGG